MSYRLRSSLKTIPKKLILAGILDLAAVALILGALFLYTHNQPTAPINSQAAAAAPKLSAQQIYDKYLADCPDQRCVFDNIRQATDAYGVGSTISALLILQQKGSNPNTGDPHLWAHEVGSEAVRRFGVSAKTLMMCTDDFNYGCQHGFFETAATKNQSVGEIAIKLCGQVENDPSFSYKHKFYCYHGAGHGIMQTADYNLSSALATCDRFPTLMGNQGCWQGVFMEADNVVGDPDGQGKGFSTPADPLAPCNHVAQKYQNECYINVGQGLIRVEKSNIVRASQDCLGAGDETNIKTCMDGLGIIIGNNLWQEQFTNLSGSFIENTWTICQDFPSNYTDRCIFGAVAQINNMDGLNIARVNQFCQLVSANLKSWCYQSIGNDIRAEADAQTVIQKCQQLPNEFVQACKQGAQV